MTRKERVKLAIGHRQPDRVPHQVGLAIPAGQMLREHPGTNEFPGALRDHLALIDEVRNQPGAEDAVL